jgi:CrcB protein
LELWVRVLVLSVGGVLGVNARYWLGVWISQWADPRFPWATFVVNVSGAFAAGFLSTALANRLPNPHVRVFVVAGFLGGYTTFSAFALESLTLWDRRAFGRAWGYVLGSCVAGLTAVALGAALAQNLIPERPLPDPLSLATPNERP